MKPSGCSRLEPGTPKSEIVVIRVSIVTGAALKSDLTLPKLAPAFTPAYQPVQLKTEAGAGAGGEAALTDAERAKAPAVKAAIANALIITHQDPRQASWKRCDLSVP